MHIFAECECMYLVTNYILKQQKSNNSRNRHTGVPTLDLIFYNIGSNTHLLKRFS